jgi:micrococcal nuclease
MIGLIVCANLSAVDGNTVKCDRISLRDIGDGAPLVSGYYTPEIGWNAKCDREND